MSDKKKLYVIVVNEERTQVLVDDVTGVTRLRDEEPRYPFQVFDLGRILDGVVLTFKRMVSGDTMTMALCTTNTGCYSGMHWVDLSVFMDTAPEYVKEFLQMCKRDGTI